MEDRMMKTHLSTSFIGLLLCFTFAHAQEAIPREDFKVYLDYSRFRGDNTNLYVEVYYAFPQASLSYAPDTAGWRAEVELTLIASAGDSIKYADRWIVPHTVRDMERMQPGMNLIGVTGLMLGMGDYELTLIGQDRMDVTRRDSVTAQLPIREMETGPLVLSDLELSSSIKEGHKGSVFYKNTLEVIPNVTGVYMEGQRCHVYAEAYNILLTDDRSDYFVRLLVVDGAGREVISRERPRKRVGESSVIVDNVPVQSLKSGTYTMVLSLLDSSRSVKGSAAKKFFVFNQTLGVDSTLSAKETRSSTLMYAGVEESELDLEFEWARHEATDTDKKRYDQLKGAESKKVFLTEFWERRPLGYREEYLQRVAYANGHFRMLGRQGYHTDRGRVYIKYGPPDDIERFPSEAESRPYEIWSYNSIQGGVIFVFVLRQAGGDYDLVHSTHRNELHDENWQRYSLTR